MISNGNSQNTVFNSSNSYDNENTETVDVEVLEVDTLKEEKDKKQKVNFLDKDLSKDLFSAPATDDTGQANSIIDDDEDDEENEENETNIPEPEPELTPKDFRDEAEFILDIFDGIMQNVCYAISGEKDKGLFAIEKDKKKKLNIQLSVILHKHRVRMSIEAMFCISIIAIYFNPIRQAISMRNDKKQKKQQYGYEDNKTVQPESKGKYNTKKRTSEAA